MNWKRRLLTLSALATAWASGHLPVALGETDEKSQFHKEIVPILESHCFSCHGPEKQRADLNLSIFKELEAVAESPEVWEGVLERVQSFEMPPSGSPELGFNRHQRLMRFLRTLPKPAKPDCDQLASDRNTSFYGGYVMSRRLNRAEYRNTVRDLLGVELAVDELLPADGGGGEGFDTTGSALFTSSIHVEKYLAAAERILEKVLPSQPPETSPALERARASILIAEPGESLPAREAARKIVSHFAERAFRRPVQAEEVERVLTMFDRAAERGDDFSSSIRLALKAVLISPNFLFLAEPDNEEGGIHKLGPVPLASKLSYFIWSSMPDAELYELAKTGELSNPEVYRAQIHRMLKDPKAVALGKRFSLQWLDLDRLGTEVNPDPEHFPEFDQDLNRAMHLEVTTFFNHLFQNNRSLLELIDSDFTFVNARLAALYGIDGIESDDMQLVRLADRARGGLLGMAAVHTLTSYPLRTSPVLRGRWILESLLGDKVPPPPPDVPALEENEEKAGGLSLRAQLEMHRVKAECAACHDKMDPLGFGLEHFDVLGRWRDMDRGQPIDSEGRLPSGESFTGPGGLKNVLMKRKDQIIRHLARKMTGFAFGRELNKFDACVIDRAMEALQENDYQAAILVEQIATSFPFQHRFHPKLN